MRSYYKRPRAVNNLSLFDRLIAIACYLTAGMVGFLWLIMAYIARKNLKPFIKFHAYQSIIISIGLYVIGAILKILMSVLTAIPFIGNLILTFVFYIAHFKLISSFSLLDFCIALFFGYLVLGAFLGKKSYIPVISEAVDRMV